MAGGLENPTGENMQSEEETGTAQAEANLKRGAQLAENGGQTDTVQAPFTSPIVSPDVMAVGDFQLRRIDVQGVPHMLLGGVGPGPFNPALMNKENVGELIAWLQALEARL